MAISKRVRNKGTTYQVKVKGSDGFWITETCDTLAEARKKEAELYSKKGNGLVVRNAGNQITVSSYFPTWDVETRNGNISHGWREDQVRYFHRYVEPLIGNVKLQSVTPAHISRVLAKMVDLGRAPQTRLHIYNLLHKMFEDAVEMFELLTRSPVKKSLKPCLSVKEADYLELNEIVRLLKWVEGKSYEAAVWLGIFAGLRVGEIQALKWEHVEFDPNRSLIHVRATYVRKEKRFKDTPKGEKWRTLKMPPELMEVLMRIKQTSTSEYVAVRPNQQGFMEYGGYLKALKRYCEQIGIKPIATHGLRHSTAGLYMMYGATRDDLRQFWQHSTAGVTDRYIHDKGQRMDGVANVIRLFPTPENSDVSPKFPQIENFDLRENSGEKKKGGN